MSAAPCGPDTCDGCCLDNGQCGSGDAETACGLGGDACTACGGSEICMDGSCTVVATSCNATTCPNGCCDSTGECVPGTDDTACGDGGAACEECASSLACVSQACACTTGSCTGCCQGNSCVQGNTNSACGSGGAACEVCSGGQQCAGTMCTTLCSPATCPNGCCDGNTCQPGDSTDACGAYGNACKTCGGSETCAGGVCNNDSTCGSSCAGCCKDSTCQLGTSKLACGTGDRCQICAPYQFCQATTKTCELDPASRWDVTLVQVQLWSGGAWDSGSPPDVFVKFDTGSVSGQSSTVDDNYNPVFEELVLSGTVSQLTQAIHITVKDRDFLSSNTIADYYDYIYANELQSGQLLRYYPAPNNNHLIAMEFRFAPSP